MVGKNEGKMLDNYLKIAETQAEISKEFTKGRFGVQRTMNSLPRISIVLTLETTANVSQQTGILSFQSFH